MDSIRIEPMIKLTGAFTVPGDKSITHRAIMFNSIAEGESEVRGGLFTGDCFSTIECMRALGAKIQFADDSIIIKGVRKLKNNADLNAENSATTMRLLMGILAGAGVGATIHGDKSLTTRPMQRIADPLNAMGAKVKTTNGTAPIYIKPAQLTGTDITMNIPSAQVKSAVMIAALKANGMTMITEPVPTRNHSEIMLNAMSADIRTMKNKIIIGNSRLKSLNIRVPGDISSAAYLIALATILDGSSIVIKGVGINRTRRTVIDLINASGGNITVMNRRRQNDEPVADLFVQSAKMMSFNITGTTAASLIDELPILCVMACYAEGTSTISGAEELRVKESDRIKSVVNLIRAMGGDIKEHATGMIIRGTGILNGGAEIDPGNDHRIALTAAVAAAVSVDGAVIYNPEIANISYPNYYNIFGAKL